MGNKKLLPVLLALIFSILIQSQLYGQKESQVIGQIGKTIVLEKVGENFKIQYENNNESSSSTTNELIIEDITTLNRLYNFLIDGFESMNTGPVQFKLPESELRIYYINRIGKDKVEIIHEDKQTEETGTMQRLTLKELRKLFGKND